MTYRSAGLLAAAAPASSAPPAAAGGIFLALRRGVRVSAAASPARRSNPTVIRWTVLEELRILAPRMTLGVIRGRLAEDLARPQGVVVDLGHHHLISIVVLWEPRERTQVVVADDHHIDTGHRRNVIGIGDTGWRLDQDHHQHVVVKGLAVIDAVDAPDARRLARPGAAPRHWWKARPLHRLPGSIHIVHGGYNDTQHADVGGMLDVPFLRVREPDHRNCAGVRARRDHGLDVLELQRAVLHFEPGVVVVLCRLAIPRDIKRRLREAEDLLAFPEFLYDGVVQLRLGGILASQLTGRRYEGKRKTENHTNDRDRRSHHGRPPGADVRADSLGKYIPARDEKKRGQGGQSQSGGGRKRPQPSTGMRSWRSLRLYEKPV